MGTDEPDNNGRRPQCARCSIKHLAQARALVMETCKGYPEHVWYAIGHMAEAEDECVELMPMEAGLIRKERLRIEQGLKDGAPAKVDWKALMTCVATGAMLEETL